MSYGTTTTRIASPMNGNVQNFLLMVSTIKTFRYRSLFNCTARELYDFHSRPGALERLLPPWDGSEVVWKKGTIGPGGRVLLKLRQGPIHMGWEAHHVEEIPGVMFRDIQHKGPFSHFSHTHRFSDTNAGALLEDIITFALPCQCLLPSFTINHVIAMLTRIFTHREHTLREDLRIHSLYSRKPLRILVSGASGVLGCALVPLLTTGGHDVWTLVRRTPEPGKQEIFWDPANGILNPDDLPELDGVIHLAGEYIGLGRWSQEKKRMVVESRTRGTGLLADTISSLPKKPAVFLSASAVGYYGDSGDTVITETHPPGNDFISEVCTAWEEAATPATAAGIRTVLMRLRRRSHPARRGTAAAARHKPDRFLPAIRGRQSVHQLDVHRRHDLRHAPLPGHSGAFRALKHRCPATGHQPGVFTHSGKCGGTSATPAYPRLFAQDHVWTDGLGNIIIRLSRIF